MFNKQWELAYYLNALDSKEDSFPGHTYPLTVNIILVLGFESGRIAVWAVD